MKKKKPIRSLVYGKGFYITAAVSFCLVVLAIVMVYRTSTGMIRDILTTSYEEITEDVRKNKTDETYPEFTLSQKTTVPTTEEPETSMAWSGKDKNETTAPLTTAEVTEEVISNDSYVLPLTEKIQKGFSPDSPVYDETMGDWRVHTGIDFSAEKGSEVKSVGNGKVTKVMSDASWGYVVEIDHGDFTARYCGLTQGTTVKNGETVEKGDTVGKLGEIPCENEQEDHLHFEVVKNEKKVDPISAMKLTLN